jgi:hypothetical protein
MPQANEKSNLIFQNDLCTALSSDTKTDVHICLRQSEVLHENQISYFYFHHQFGGFADRLQQRHGDDIRRSSV